MDTSATFRAFVSLLTIAVVVVMLVVWFGGFQVLIVRSFGLRDSEDLPYLLSVFAAGVLILLVPLAFIVWDWAARKPWRTLAAVNGALLGVVAFVLGGALIGAATDSLVYEYPMRDAGPRLAVAMGFGLVAAALAVLLVSESRSLRRIIQWALVLVAAMAVVAFILFVEPGNGWRGVRNLVSRRPEPLWLVVNALLLLFVLVRAVRNRIVLSGRTPRGLLLGDFRRSGFWVRMAFLLGLPSSLWHARALSTLAFWAFLLARPLVYIGVAFVFSGAQRTLGWPMQTTIAVVLVLAGHALFHIAKRLATAYAWDPHRTFDQGAPILFLRSFEDDQLRFHRPIWNLGRRWLDLWSFRRNADEALIDEVAQYGPVVALGMPGEEKVPFGASRYYASHEDWQEIVTRTARDARAIVLAAGHTAGVLWEYEMLAREGLLAETLLLFPPDDDDGNSGGRAALEAFEAATGVNVEVNGAAGRRLIALLPSSDGHLLVVADEADAAAYVAAIRGFMQEIPPSLLADPLLERIH